MTPDELFEKNQRLVHYCFHKYIGSSCSPNAYEDVLQEGFLGLWLACSRYDSERDVKFSTFAVTYITGAMRRYLRENNSTIRVSRSDWEAGDIAKYQTASLDMTLTEDGDTTLKEIVPAPPDDYEGLTEDLIDSFIERERLRRQKLPNAKSDVIERDLVILEEYLYGVTFFEYSGQEATAKKYGVSQATVARTIKKGKQRFKEFIQSVDK